MTEQKQRVIWLIIGAVVYCVAWVLLAGQYPKLNDELPQLLMSGPALYFMMLLIVEGDLPSHKTN